MKELTFPSIMAGLILKNCIELSRLLNYPSFDELFICGPETMIFSVKEFLEQKDIDKKKIHFELFTTPGQKKSEVSPSAIAQDEVGGEGRD